MIPFKLWPIVALFAAGPTIIKNVAHIRHKETDRIAAVATELRKLGADVTEQSDGLTIIPKELRAASIDTYRDHRMAMSFALAGLRIPGVRINDPGCVDKTYPRFFDDLAELTQQIVAAAQTRLFGPRWQNICGKRAIYWHPKLRRRC